MVFNIGNLFIGELFIISEDRTLHFMNSGIFVDGRNQENGANKLRINGIVSQSVIYLSGRTQGMQNSVRMSYATYDIAFMVS